MSNRVDIKQTNYFVEDIKRAVVFTDEVGNEFRITFLPGGGISVNKYSDEESEITIKPKVTNEIILL